MLKVKCIILIKSIIMSSESWYVLIAKHIKKSKLLGKPPLSFNKKRVAIQNNVYGITITQIFPNCGKWIASIIYELYYILLSVTGHLC